MVVVSVRGALKRGCAARTVDRGNGAHMSGSRQLVYWHGLLKKGHEETPCTVQAWEVIDAEGDPPTYTRHRIIDVPKRLRDGVYDLEAHGEKFKVRRAKGFWVTAYPVVRV